MAEVKDDVQAEPSMEEILASIRKIIADDTPTVASPDEGNDVIELTQMVQDDGSVVDLAAPEPEAAPEPPPPQSPPPEPVLPPLAAAPSDGLVSAPVESAAVSSLSALASTLEIDRLASAPGEHTYLGNGQRTLEDMALELMRPMLREWLDRNLPATVDRLVQKEIERIARKAKD